MFYTVYILECADKTLYTGCTNDLKKRLKAHNGGKSGAKYTRSRRPVRLVYSETTASVSAALRREAAIKRMKRVDKMLLIKNKPR